MPSTHKLRGLRMVLDPKSSWDDLIKYRLGLMKSVLKENAFPSLGDLLCMRYFDNPATLESRTINDTLIDCSGHGLATQGIFTIVPNSRVTNRAEPNHVSVIKNGHVLVWGLTREATWMIVTVHFDILSEGTKDAPETDTVNRVYGREADLPTLLEWGPLKPVEVWDMFSAAAARRMNSRKAAYKSARELYEEFEVQDQVVDITRLK